jgi:hypothetical protein
MTCMLHSALCLSYSLFYYTLYKVAKCMLFIVTSHQLSIILLASRRPTISIKLIFLHSCTLCIFMPSEKETEIRRFVNPKIFMRISSIHESQIYTWTLQTVHYRLAADTTSKIYVASGLITMLIRARQEIHSWAGQNHYHTYTPTNANNLYKITYNPQTWTVLRVSGIHRHPQGDDLKLKPLDFMYMDDLWFYKNRVHLLVYADVYSYNTREELYWIS